MAIGLAEILWITLVGIRAVLCQQNTTSKFRTTPGPYQDTVDSQDGQAIVPLIQLNSTDFVIGGLFGLTQGPGGPTDFKGVQRALAFQCAIESLNNNATMQTGRTYYYYMMNDSNSAPEAISAAANLIQSGLQVVVGASSSATTLSAAALLTSFNITLLGASASTIDLNREDRYPTFLRVGSSDTDQAAAIAATMVHFNWSLITPIYTNDPYGLSGQSQFVVQAQNNRISLTCGRVINPGQLNGITDTIRCLQQSDSNVVLLWMNSENAANVIAAFYAAGGNLSRLNFIAVDSWSNIFDFEQFSQGRFPLSYIVGTLEFSPRLGDQSLFNECLSGQNPTTSNIPGFLNYWEGTFRCIFTDDESVPLCSPLVNERAFNPPNCRCDGSEQLDQVGQENAVSYYLDSVYAIGNAFLQLQNNCTGLSDALDADICGADSITTTQFEEIISINAFYGSTGYLQFQGNLRLNMTFEIRQRRTNGSLPLVGLYDIDGISLDQQMLIFKDPTQIPVSYIVPQQIELTSPIGLVFLFLTVLCLITSISFSITFWIYRKEKVIKKTSPFFSQLILIGIDLCLLSQICWGLNQAQWTCILKVSLLAIGFGLIMGNLLAKNYRILKIFTNMNITSMIMKDTDLLKFSAVILLIECLLLAGYFFLSGFPNPFPRPVNIQSTSDSLLLIIQCAVPSSFVQLAFNIALLVFNGLLILCGVVIAYKSRNIESSFNESKYIGITVYIYLLVVIILLPLYYTAGDSGSSVARQYVLRNISVLASMYFTLCALFIPKIIAIRKERKEQRLRAATRGGATSDSTLDSRRRRIITTFGSTPNSGNRQTSATEGESGLFTRLLTSQGGSISIGGAGGRDSTINTNTMTSTTSDQDTSYVTRTSAYRRTRYYNE